MSEVKNMMKKKSFEAEEIKSEFGRKPFKY